VTLSVQTGSLVHLILVVGQFTARFTWRQTAHRSPLLQFAAIRVPIVLLQFFALRIRFVFTTHKEGAGQF
jgi:hypothetical protein